MTRYDEIVQEMTGIFGEIRTAATLADASRKKLPGLKQTRADIQKQHDDARLAFETYVKGDLVSLPLYQSRRDNLELLQSSIETVQINISIEEVAIVRCTEKRDKLESKYRELEKELANSQADVIAFRS